MTPEERLAAALRSDVLMHAIAPGDTIQAPVRGVSVDGAEVRRRLVAGIIAVDPTLICPDPDQHSAYVGPIQHRESQTVECWCRHCVWWKERAIEEERERIRAAVKTIPSSCHSHSGLNCEADEYGSCYLIDRTDVFDVLAEPHD